MNKSSKSFANIPQMELGVGKTYAANQEIEAGGYQIRVKATVDSSIRLKSQSSSEVLLSAGETEYFFVPDDEVVVVNSGSVNVMY